MNSVPFFVNFAKVGFNFFFSPVGFLQRYYKLSCILGF